ncbi:murein hydrolase activator EnvC family protein [Vibrio gallicus]|uniref:murein hydrolase activator EnvC family protein n=1 Tax=Vibrio gallicus TaxID=190897 RepID=UPI0021C4C0E2|nr:peptidoglycan DD-metalloendopeptidase family protein [Vibrio gallicus]
MTPKPTRKYKSNVSVKSTGVLLLLATSLLYSTAPLANTADLKGVTGEITRQQKNLVQQQKDLDKLQKQLKTDELAIANATKKLKQTQSTLKYSQSNARKFQAEYDDLVRQTKQQTQDLKKLVKAYYMMQSNAKLDNFLSQDSAQEKDRMSQYYQHLAIKRTEAIERLKQTNEALQQKNQQLLAEQQQIKGLLNEQSNQLAKLKKSQSSRKGTVAKFRRNIKGDTAHLNELKRNEARLKAEIAKAAKRNSVPMDGLAKQRGKLPWPIKGRVLHRYGSTQSGQVDWKGIVINANYEQPVKAVYPGKVVFADYLRGYGLVMLIDHGKGDMTLYGYNQVLTKKEGDKVTAGETIALAGDTGGQNRASVYFELRRNSRTQNPQRWLKK